MSYVRRAAVPATCSSGKIRYVTHGDALHWLARSGRWAAGMDAYRCGPCGGWHVGHAWGQGKGKNRRGRRR